MTVAELITKLGEYDGASKVVVSGFDGFGFEDMTCITEVTVLEDSTGTPGSHCPRYDLAEGELEIGTTKGASLIVYRGQPVQRVVYLDY